MLVLPILVPLSTAAVLMLAPKRPGPQRGISLGGALLLLASTVLVFVRVNATGIQVLQVSAWPAPFGITLVADLFSAALMQQAMAWLTGSGGAPGVTCGGLGYAPAGQNKYANLPGADAFAAMRPSEGRWRVWGSGFGATRSIDGASPKR